MYPQNLVPDIMRRTMTNLRFVEQHRQNDGPFEVTQLVNSFLGAMAHPWEQFKSELNQLSLQDAERDGWPRVVKERPKDQAPQSLGDLLRLVRNSLAHGNIKFLPDDANEICALRIWNKDNGRRTWGATVPVEDMRRFLDRFVDLAEHLHERQGRQKEPVA